MSIDKKAAEAVFQQFKHVNPRLNKAAIELLCTAYEAAKSEQPVDISEDALNEALLTLRPQVWQDITQQVMMGEIPAAQLPIKVEMWSVRFRPFLKAAIQAYLSATRERQSSCLQDSEDKKSCSSKSDDYALQTCKPVGWVNHPHPDGTPAKQALNQIEGGVK